MRYYLTLFYFTHIDPFKTSSRSVTQKTAEATGDLTGNKIADQIKKVSRNLQQNNSEAVRNEHDKEIPTGRYISSEEGWLIIDELRIIK